MYTTIAGLSNKAAPLEILEQLSVHHSQNELCVQGWKAAAGLAGAVVLSTCNRLEFYGVCEDADEGVARVRDFILGQGGAADAAPARQFRELCTPSRTGAPCAICSRSCAAWTRSSWARRR